MIQKQQNHSQDPDDDDSDSDVDLDLTVDMMALGNDGQKDINKVGKGFNLGKDDFVRFLARDIEEQEELRAAKQEEEKKSALQVRRKFLIPWTWVHFTKLKRKLRFP